MPGERNSTPAPLPVWTEDPGLDNPAFEESAAADCTCRTPLPGLSLAFPPLPIQHALVSCQDSCTGVRFAYHTTPAAPCSSSWLQSRNKARVLLEEAGPPILTTGTRYSQCVIRTMVAKPQMQHEQLKSHYTKHCVSSVNRVALRSKQANEARLKALSLKGEGSDSWLLCAWGYSIRAHTPATCTPTRSTQSLSCSSF